MNILWIYNMPLQPEAGGTERITSLVAKGLSQYGHNCLGILVFDEQKSTITYGTKPLTDLYTFLKESQIDVVINQIAYAKWLLDSFLKMGGDRWQNEGGKIISCLHFDPKNPSLLYMLRSQPHKTFTDRLNLVKANILYKYHEKKQQQNEGATYNFIYDHSDWLVALSPTHFPYLHKVMKRREYERLTAINNPLTFDEISQPEILADKKKIVMVCARMSEYHKRISIILKAWMAIQKSEKAREWTLQILGTGPDLQRYRDFVCSNRIPNVQFEGQQSPEPFYHHASILLLTSSAEGWGLTLTEGLQRGVVPVVMNSCPVLSEIIESGYNGYLTPNNDIKAFGKKILALMQDAAALGQMQLNALQSAKKFSMDNTILKWCKII